MLWEAYVTERGHGEELRHLETAHAVNMSQQPAQIAGQGVNQLGTPAQKKPERANDPLDWISQATEPYSSKWLVT